MLLGVSTFNSRRLIHANFCGPCCEIHTEFYPCKVDASEVFDRDSEFTKQTFPVNPLSANPTKWSNTLKQITQLLPTTV